MILVSLSRWHRTGKMFQSVQARARRRKKAKKHSEVFELSMEEAQNKLEDLELKGRIRKLKVANGCFWEPAE